MDGRAGVAPAVPGHAPSGLAASGRTSGLASSIAVLSGGGCRMGPLVCISRRGADRYQSGADASPRDHFTLRYLHRQALHRSLSSRGVSQRANGAMAITDLSGFSQAARITLPRPMSSAQCLPGGRGTSLCRRTGRLPLPALDARNSGTLLKGRPCRQGGANLFESCCVTERPLLT